MTNKNKINIALSIITVVLLLMNYLMETEVVLPQNFHFPQSLNYNSKINEKPPEKERPFIPQIESQILFQLHDRPNLGITFEEPGKFNLINRRVKYAVIAVNLIEVNSSVIYLSSSFIACLGWLQHGYGCFFILTHLRNQLRKDSNDDFNFQAINFIKKLSRLQKFLYNIDNKIVLSYLQIKKSENLPIVSQISRLYIGKMIKLACENELNFQEDLKSIQFITTDADLIPLNVMAHDDFAHDFYLVNPFNVDKMSAALSCVLATAGNWVDLIPDDIIENEDILFSDKILNQSYHHRKIISQKKISQKKVNWFLDQTLLPHYLKIYRDKYFKKIDLEDFKFRISSQTTFSLDKNERIDRIEGRLTSSSSSNSSSKSNKLSGYDSLWYNKIDQLKNSFPFKDAHFCRLIFESKCFFSLLTLLKDGLKVHELELKLLKDFQNALVDQLSLKNSALGTDSEKIIAFNSRDDENPPKVYIFGYKPISIYNSSEQLIKAYPENLQNDRQINYFIVEKGSVGKFTTELGNSSNLLWELQQYEIKLVIEITVKIMQFIQVRGINPVDNFVE